ncbi:MAG: hypothetical protein RLZZ387_320 [Chloroflexota bacterium]
MSSTPPGRPHIAYNAASPHLLGYTWCDDGCGTPETWKRQAIESSGTLDQEFKPAAPLSCKEQGWFNAVPTLALDPQGNPRIARLCALGRVHHCRGLWGRVCYNQRRETHSRKEGTMEYRRLGRSGLKVAPICLGSMQFGWTADEEQSFRIMDAYADAGGNFIDTADIYSAWIPGNPGGVSEEIIGRWLKRRGDRHMHVVATKVQGRMWPGPNGAGLSRGHIMKAVDDSLRRLQTDYIDLYQTHWPDYETPQEETMHALDDLVRAGKVRYIGCSNEPAGRLTKAMWISEREGLSRFVSLQPPYSMVKRANFERENQAVCQDFGIGVIPYSPLQGGFLTGKYRRGATPDSVRAEGLKKFMTERNYDLIEALERIGQARGATVTQVALAWTLAQPAITSPIIGANSVEQLNDILGTLSVALTPEELKTIDDASEWKSQEI